MKLRDSTSRHPEMGSNRLSVKGTQNPPGEKMQQLNKKQHLCFYQWITILICTSFIATSATVSYGNDASGSASEPKVFAHYFTPYPLSLDDVPVPIEQDRYTILLVGNHALAGVCVFEYF